MKKIALALAAVVLIAAATPQMVAPYSVPQAQGTFLATNDRVTLNVSGTQWATVRLSVTSAGTATATVQISTDDGPTYGVNFSASAYAQRVSTASANPTVQAISATTLTTGDVWEVPIPSNATQFSVLCAGSGTATTVSLYGSRPYVPGAPVTAVLYDVTSAVNTALDTGTLELGGWEFASVEYTTPAGGSGTISRVDDVGATATMFSVPASALAWYPFAMASPSVTQVTALPTSGATGALPIQKRMRFQSAGVAALTSRIRIEGRR